MKKINLALTAETKRLPAAELNRVAAALNKQLHNDFAPLWKINAELTPFSRPRDVPPDYWPITVRDHIAEGMWSIHDVKDGRPYVEVTYDENWTLGASHDMLEMLVDPWLRRTVRAPSVERGKQRDVDYMVQICDPCASPTNGYRIDDVLVADFSTPDYWKTDRQENAKYSFTGALTKPFQILRGGYLSWKDPKTNHWWQKTWWGRQPQYRDLGAFTDEAAGEGQDKKARVIRERRVLFHVVMLRDFYREQQPLLQSIRAEVEKLIADYST